MGIHTAHNIYIYICTYTHTSNDDRIMEHLVHTIYTDWWQPNRLRALCPSGVRTSLGVDYMDSV